MHVYLLNFYWIILPVEVFKICIYWTNACIDVQLFFFWKMSQFLIPIIIYLHVIVL